MSSYFTYKNHDSKEFGLLESTPMPTPNDELVNMAETPGNITDAYYATGRYAHQELQVVLGIPDKSKIRAIHEWLTGNGELIFSDEPDKYYKVIKIEKTPERMSVRFGKINITFTVEPFAYAVEPTQTNLTDATSYTEVLNNSSFFSTPEIRLIPTSETVVINTNGKNFELNNLDEQVSNGDIVVIDSELSIVYYIRNNQKHDITYKSKYSFPLLHTGSNYIYHDGHVASMSINVRERWL
jgi:predicted phage tail component-like protein